MADMAARLNTADSNHVAVIGGGCAGLAAAARLASQGKRVTLFEASPHFGGRARRVRWQGETLDNGQHILLGAYQDTLALLRLVGVDCEQALLRLPLQLEIHGRFKLRACPWLPAPLHILVGLLTADGLRWGERWQAIRFMAWLKHIDFQLQQDLPLADLLARRRQPEHLIRWLWEPLCLAALNTPLDTASAQVFLHVLRDSFARGKTDSDMLLPRQDLSALLADPVIAYVRQHGGQCKPGCAVEAIEADEDGYRLVTTDGIAGFSEVIVAVHPARAPDLLARLPNQAESRATTAALHYQPIYTIYIQYAADTRLPAAMLGLTDGIGQWVFDRGQLYGQHGLLAVVISAEGRHQRLTQARLAETVIAELSRQFPLLPAARWHKVIAEKRATFACTAGLKRPATITADTGLLLAGDYVAGDYPATIEGAVRSGFCCADHILAHLTQPTS
ncbi:MAG TPA: hydroxysqualene dehydroxylase HpnE [Methylophilaceae bacterium]|nr:hydroxysqualene dehydroxylase HpnE [Methylophilaceae bacterium]